MLLHRRHRLRERDEDAAPGSRLPRPRRATCTGSSRGGRSGCRSPTWTATSAWCAAGFSTASSCTATAGRSASSWSSWRSAPARSSAKCPVHHYARELRPVAVLQAGAHPQDLLHLAGMWLELMVLDKIRRGRLLESRRDRSRRRRAPTTIAPSTASRRVMITGGLGFIGSNLAAQLVELGARVLIVDSLIPDYGGNLFNIGGIEDDVRVNIADVRQQQHDELPGARSGGDLQPRRPGEPHRQHAGPVHGPRDQLPRAAVACSRPAAATTRA